MGSVFLLTGKPGTGKTTVIRETLSHIKARAGGFYTEEIRVFGNRKGFKIITLDGQEEILSYVDLKSACHVGKYGVNIDALEKVAVASLDYALKETGLIIIDEIGKMELFSPLFKEAVLRIIDSGKNVLGTIMSAPSPFADKIRNHPSVNLISLTLKNRNAVLQDLIKQLS